MAEAVAVEMGSPAVSGGERSEPERSAGEAGTPDPEVPAKAKRRKFTAAYKLRVLEQADACQGSGEIGALLRREGLYSSHLSVWRRQRDEGALAGLSVSKRGRKGKDETVPIKDFKRVEKENARLRHELEKAEFVIEVQKKVSEILGIPLEKADKDESS